MSDDQSGLACIEVNSMLVEHIVHGTQQGLMMTGIQPRAIGASKLLRASRNVSVLIGLLGDYTGTMTLNLSNHAAATFSGALLGEENAEFTEDTLDAVGEIGNMVAGGIKDLLLDSKMAFSNISCPTVVMGPSYELYYSTGFTTVCVEFEIPDVPVIQMEDKVFSVSVSLMKR
jgi:chemotaxis protein CheX